MSREQPRLHDRVPSVVVRERDVATGRLRPLGNGDRRGKRDRNDASRTRRARVPRSALVAAGAVVAISAAVAGAAVVGSGDDDAGQAPVAPVDVVGANTADAYSPTYELTWSMVDDENPASSGLVSGATTATVECLDGFECSFLSDRPIPLANFVSFQIGDDLRGAGREETPIPASECEATRIVEIAFEPVEVETVDDASVVSAFEGTIALTWDPPFAESGCEGSYASTVAIGAHALDPGATLQPPPDAAAGYVGGSTLGALTPVRQAVWDGTTIVEDTPYPDDTVGFVFDCVRQGCTHRLTTTPDAAAEFDGDSGTGEHTYVDACGTTWRWSIQVLEWAEVDGIPIPARVSGTAEVMGTRAPNCVHPENRYEGTLAVELPGDPTQ